MTQPNNAAIDYDLYILDNEGNILCGCENYTYINGAEGTLQESVGYMTTGNDIETYYLAVLSSVGGSESEPFKLEFSVSNSYDQFEIDENPSQALPLTVGSDGAVLDIRSLSSPFDNDWYVVTVPSNRIYDEFSIGISTKSSNTC